MKQKNSKKPIKRNALRHAGGSRNYVRRSFSRKAISFTGQAGAGVKIPAENKPSLKSVIPINKSGTLKKDHLKLVPKMATPAVEQNPLTEKPAVEKPLHNTGKGGDSVGGRNSGSDGGGGSRWNNPRTSGLAAAALLLVMLVTAVWSANANDNAGNEPADLSSAQTGSLQLSKEYIYAGSRMLAIEDYGLSGTPTATPTPATPTPTPSTPTPTPVIASCPTGYSSLGGIINGNPTATVFNNALFVFAKGTNDAIYYRKTADGSNYDGYVGLGGYLISDPKTLVTYNSLTVEAIGTDNSPYYRNTFDGTNFSEWAGGTVGAQTTAAAYFGGNTYTFVKGDGTQPPLCVNVTPGGTPTPVPPTPTPTPLPNNYSPTGNLDSADGATASITGWSYDPDNPSASNQVHLYIDGSTFLGSVNADQSRPDVNSAFGISGNHGFSFTIPSQYLDGNQHSVYAYGIDTGANNPAQLSNVPLYFQYPVPTPTPTPCGQQSCPYKWHWSFETCQCEYGPGEDPTPEP